MNVEKNDDLDVINLMEEKDEKLIADEVLYGCKSSTFVYEFEIKKGQKVAGISVAGAEYLARKYGHLSHKIIATAHKMGKKFILTSYCPLDVKCSLVDELANEPDHYQVVIEVSDTRNSNTRQMVKTELRYGTTRNGDSYEKPHYTTIAESKAYRNAVLSLVPKDVQEKFKEMCIKDGNSENMTTSLIDEKRKNCMVYASEKGLLLNSQNLDRLNWDELNSLSDAAREGIDNFRTLVISLDLMDNTKSPQISFK